eukprot:GHVR01038784.1.p1 GENE.GHVR01038784.1~~GHVR01038784.1.p1  ORF type:complete len:394 (-),score=55.02 GHVR01038784.1:129-1310(-)
MCKKMSTHFQKRDKVMHQSFPLKLLTKHYKCSSDIKGKKYVDVYTYNPNKGSNSVTGIHALDSKIGIDCAIGASIVFNWSGFNYESLLMHNKVVKYSTERNESTGVTVLKGSILHDKDDDDNAKLPEDTKVKVVKVDTHMIRKEVNITERKKKNNAVYFDCAQQTTEVHDDWFKTNLLSTNKGNKCISGNFIDIIMYSITLGVMPFTQGDNKNYLPNQDNRLKKFSHITLDMYEKFKNECTYNKLEELFIEIKLTYKDNKTKKEIKLKTPIINNTRYNLSKFVTPWNIRFTEETKPTFIIGSGILQDNLMNKTWEIRGGNIKEKGTTKGDILYFFGYASEKNNNWFFPKNNSKWFVIAIASKQDESPKQSSSTQLQVQQYQATLNPETIITEL